MLQWYCIIHCYAIFILTMEQSVFTAALRCLGKILKLSHRLRNTHSHLVDTLVIHGHSQWQEEEAGLAVRAQALSVWLEIFSHGTTASPVLVQGLLTYVQNIYMLNEVSQLQSRKKQRCTHGNGRLREFCRDSVLLTYLLCIKCVVLEKLVKDSADYTLSILLPTLLCDNQSSVIDHCTNIASDVFNKQPRLAFRCLFRTCCLSSNSTAEAESDLFHLLISVLNSREQILLMMRTIVHIAKKNPTVSVNQY